MEDVQRELKPWDKQQGEPHKAWFFFKIFLDLDFCRTYEKTDKLIGCSRANIARLGSEFDWMRRANLYDMNRYDEGKKIIA